MYRERVTAAQAEVDSVYIATFTKLAISLHGGSKSGPQTRDHNSVKS